jgi:hypothetical protein
VSSGAYGAVEVAENYRPVFGRYILHSVDHQGGVELLRVMDLLEVEDAGAGSRLFCNAAATTDGDWSVAVTRRPCANAAVKYRPVPQAASRMCPLGGQDLTTAPTNRAWVASIGSSLRS